MSVITQNHILNIVPGMSAPVVVHVSQGDSGVELEFVLVNGSEIFDPTGTVISVHGIRQDGTGWGPVACAREDGKIKFTLPDAATAVKGSGMAELSISNGEETVGTTNFAILVETATFPQGVTYANDVSVYEAILAYVDQMGEQTVQNVEADLAAEIANRQAADAVLQQNINSEASTRAGADTTLQTNLNNAVSSLNEALTNEVTARTSADSLLGTRIDEIIAPSGEAPSAAEVTDARIGANGKTYATLGNAIRNQITDEENLRTNSDSMLNVEVAKRIKAQRIYNQNMFDGIFENAIYNGADGVKSVRQDFISSVNPIVASGGDYIRFSNFPIDFYRAYILCWAADDSWIGASSFIYTSLDANGEYTLQALANTAYIRIMFNFSDTSARDPYNQAHVYIEVNPMEDFEDPSLNLFATQNKRLWRLNYVKKNYSSTGATWQYQDLKTINVQATKTYALLIGNCGGALPAENTLGFMCLYEEDSSNNILYRHWIPFNNKGIVTITMGNSTAKLLIEIVAAHGTQPTTSGSFWVENLCFYEVVGDVPDYIPSYYDSHLVSKITTIRALDDSIGSHGDRFIFFTDEHKWWFSEDRIASLLKYLQDQFSISMTVFGGDGVNMGNNEAQFKDRLVQFLSQFKGVRNFYPVIGNHEFYSDWDNEGSYKGGITASEVYSYFNKDLETSVDGGDGVAGFYKDNKIQKIRYYFLGCDYDVTIPASTQTWFINSLNNIPSGYTVIVFTHWAITTDYSVVSQFTPIHNALVAFNAEGNSICPLVIAGHEHLDIYAAHDGIQYVAVTTDNWKLQEGSLARSVGSYTESAFDVVSIDTANRTIDFTRIGAGTDRHFTY